MEGGRNAGGGSGGGGGGGRDRLMPSRMAWRIFSTLETSSSCRDRVLKTLKKILKYCEILNSCTCTYMFVTWPSHISSKEALSLVALASLLWNNFPSKKPQGQQWSHGRGCPHTSFTNRAVSTPLMNRDASCTPRLSTFSTWYQCQREEI